MFGKTVVLTLVLSGMLVACTKSPARPSANECGPGHLSNPAETLPGAYSAWLTNADAHLKNPSGGIVFLRKYETDLVGSMYWVQFLDPRNPFTTTELMGSHALPNPLVWWKGHRALITTRSDNDGFAIYQTDGGNGEERVMRTAIGRYHYPSWTNDGRLCYFDFNACFPDGYAQCVVLGNVRLTLPQKYNPVTDWNPSDVKVSPDGRFVAILEDEFVQVFRVRGDSLIIKEVLEIVSTANSMSWDQKNTLLYGKLTSGGGAHIWRFDPVTEEESQLTTGNETFDAYPCDTGETGLFFCRRGITEQRMHVFRQLNNGAVTQITTGNFSELYLDWHPPAPSDVIPGTTSAKPKDWR